MKQAFLVTLSSLFLIQQSFATTSGGFHCPLQNDHYAALREAARVLKEQITVPDECRAYEKDIKENAKVLSNALNDLGTILDGEVDRDSVLQDVRNSDAVAPVGNNDAASRIKADTEGPDTWAHAMVAVDAMSSLQEIFQKQECVGVYDKRSVMESMLKAVDVLTPYMVFYSSNPLTQAIFLGARVLSGAIGHFLQQLKNAKPDMRQEENRDRFVRNACSFLKYSKVLESIHNIDEEKIRMGHVLETNRELLGKLKEKSNALKAAYEAALKARPDVDEDFKGWKKQEENEKEILEFFKTERNVLLTNKKEEAPGLPGLFCDEIKEQLEMAKEDAFPSQLIARLRTIFKDSKGKKQRLHRALNTYERMFLNDERVKRDFAWNAIEPSSPTCVNAAFAWVRAVERLSELSQDELSKRDVQYRHLEDFEGILKDSDEEIKLAKKAYDDAQKEVSPQDIRVKGFEKRQEYLGNLTDRGWEAEMQELSMVQSTLRYALFGGSKKEQVNVPWFMKIVPIFWFVNPLPEIVKPGPAWMEQVYNFASLQLSSFQSDYQSIYGMLQNIQAQDSRSEDSNRRRMHQEVCSVGRRKVETFTIAGYSVNTLDKFCEEFLPQLVETQGQKWCVGRYKRGERLENSAPDEALMNKYLLLEKARDDLKASLRDKGCFIETQVSDDIEKLVITE